MPRRQGHKLIAFGDVASVLPDLVTSSVGNFGNSAIIVASFSSSVLSEPVDPS